MTLYKRWGSEIFLILLFLVTPSILPSIPDLGHKYIPVGKQTTSVQAPGPEIFHNQNLTVDTVSTEADKQDTVTQSMGRLVQSNLEATITLAELQEILIKINEDLTERIDELEYSDRQEVIKILKAKKEAVILCLKELKGFDEETVALYLLMSQEKEDNTLFLLVSGVLTVIAGTAILMASYDSQTGMHWPSLDRLKSNFESIKQSVYEWFWPPQPIQPKPPIRQQDAVREKQPERPLKSQADDPLDLDPLPTEVQEKRDSPAPILKRKRGRGRQKVVRFLDQDQPLPQVPPAVLPRGPELNEKDTESVSEADDQPVIHVPERQEIQAQANAEVGQPIPVAEVIERPEQRGQPIPEVPQKAPEHVPAEGLPAPLLQRDDVVPHANIEQRDVLLQPNNQEPIDIPQQPEQPGGWQRFANWFGNKVDGIAGAARDMAGAYINWDSESSESE